MLTTEKDIPEKFLEYKLNMKNWLNFYFSKKVMHCWLLSLILFTIGYLISNYQNYIKINIASNIPIEIFKITAQSLLILIPFVGMMLIFGLGRIRDELKGVLYSEDITSLKEGWENGINLFLSFSWYVSLVVILNVILLIFHQNGSYTLGFLMTDTGLIFGALYLMGGIGVKIFGIDKKLLK